MADAHTHPSRAHGNAFGMLDEDATSPRPASDPPGLNQMTGMQPVIQGNADPERDSGQGWVLARQRSGSQSQQGKQQLRSDDAQQGGMRRYSKDALLALRKPSRIIPRMAGLEEIVSQEPLEPVSHGPFPAEHFSRIWSEGGAIRGRGRGRGGRGGRGMEGMRHRSGSAEHGVRRGSEDLWDMEPGVSGDRMTSESSGGVLDLSDMAKAALQFKSTTLSSMRGDVSRLQEHDVMDDLITRDDNEDEIDPAETFGDSSLNDVPDPNLTFGQLSGRNGMFQNNDLGFSRHDEPAQAAAVPATSNILEQLRSLSISGAEGPVHLSSTQQTFQSHTTTHHHQHQQVQQQMQLPQQQQAAPQLLHHQQSPQMQQQIPASFLASSPLMQGLAGPMVGGGLGVQQSLSTHTSYESHMVFQQQQQQQQYHREEFHHHQHAQMQMHMQQQQQQQQIQQQQHQQRQMSYNPAMQQQQQQQQQQQPILYQQPIPDQQPVIWLYRDPRGRVQGPFDSNGMRSWFAAGYFKADLPVKQQHWRDFHPLYTVFPDPQSSFQMRVSEPGHAMPAVQQDQMFASRAMPFGAPQQQLQQQAPQQLQQQQQQQSHHHQVQLEQQQRLARAQAAQHQQQAAMTPVPTSPAQTRSVEELERAAWANISELAEQEQGTAAAPGQQHAAPAASQPRVVAAKPAPWAGAAQAKTQQKSMLEIQQEEAQARGRAAPEAQNVGISTVGDVALPEPASTATLRPATLPAVEQSPAREEEHDAERQQPASPWAVGSATHKRTKSLKEIQEEEAVRRRAQEQAHAAAVEGAGAQDPGSMSIQLKSLLGVQSDSAPATSSSAWGVTTTPKSSTRSLKDIQEEQRKLQAEMPRPAPTDDVSASQAAATPALAGSWSQTKAQRAGGPSLRDIMGEQAQAASVHHQPKMTHMPRPAAVNSWAAKAAGPSYNPSALRAAEPRQTPAVPAQAKSVAVVARPEDEVDMFWNFQDTKAAPAPAASRPVAAQPSGSKKPQSEMMKWCADQMQALRGNSDVSLLQVPMSMDNAVEIREFLADILGSTPQVSQFATEFIRRKGLGGGHTKAAPAEEFQEAGKKKKKKNRGQRIDLA